MLVQDLDSSFQISNTPLVLAGIKDRDMVQAVCDLSGV